MFLNELQKENKVLFIKACVHASMANGLLAECEKETIYAYCREMDIPEHIPNDESDISDIINSINIQATDIEKKIIILELMGLIKTDAVYDEKEHQFMQKIADGLGIENGILNQLNSLLEVYIAVCKEIRAAVCE